MKPIHAKPSLYAHYFELLKEVAKEYGYNLVLHGSLNRDLDLIAIHWQEVVKPHLPMIEEFAKILGGEIMIQSQEDIIAFQTKYHGRLNYVININRDFEKKYNGFKTVVKEFTDPQYYIDISVIPVQNF